MIACGLIGLLCNPILKIWVGGTITAKPLLVWVMIAASIAATVGNVFAFFLMSVARLRQLLIAQVVLVLITLPLDFMLIPRIGPAGAAIASMFGYLIAYVLPAQWTSASKGR